MMPSQNVMLRPNHNSPFTRPVLGIGLPYLGPLPSVYNLPPPAVLAVDEEDETDPHRIHQRRKQIAFGKVTPGYVNYRRCVPKHSRQYKSDLHPVTPRVPLKVSKRKWDGNVAAWRRALHHWDNAPHAETMRMPGSRTLGEMGREPVLSVEECEACLAAELEEMADLIRPLRSGGTYSGDMTDSGTDDDDDDVQRELQIKATTAPIVFSAARVLDNTPPMRSTCTITPKFFNASSPVHHMLPVQHGAVVRPLAVREMQPIHIIGNRQGTSSPCGIEGLRTPYRRDQSATSGRQSV